MTRQLHRIWFLKKLDKVACVSPSPHPPPLPSPSLPSLPSPLLPSPAGFFTDGKSKLMKAFTATADSLRDKFSFAHTLAKEVMDEYGFEE